MSADPLPALTDAARELLTRRGLASLSTHHPGGWIHATPVGFVWDEHPARVRILTSRGSQKTRNVRRDPAATLCQVDGGSWLTFVGEMTVLERPEDVGDAETRYEQRYGHPPRPNPQRVILQLTPRRLLGSQSMFEP